MVARDLVNVSEACRALKLNATTFAANCSNHPEEWEAACERVGLQGSDEDESRKLHLLSRARLRKAALIYEAGHNGTEIAFRLGFKNNSSFFALVRRSPVYWNRLRREARQILMIPDGWYETAVLSQVPEEDTPKDKKGNIPEDWIPGRPRSHMDRPVVGRPTKLRPGCLPIWDKQKGELRIHGHLARNVRIDRAENVALILETFKRKGWPDSIENPLPPESKKESVAHRLKRLRNAVYTLNADLKYLRFHVKVGGRISWKLTA